LLGVFREDKALVSQFLASDSKLEAIHHSIAQRGRTGLKIAISVDLPLSPESKRALAYAAEEFERISPSSPMRRCGVPICLWFMAPSRRLKLQSGPPDEKMSAYSMADLVRMAESSEFYRGFSSRALYQGIAKTYESTLSISMRPQYNHKARFLASW
jgi:hypothetical protein